ncbi:MAG: glutathione synthase [Pigmentiphaga sp.]
MHVLFIVDPLPSLKAYKDTSVAMMRALVARGHALSVALMGDLYVRDGQVRCAHTPIALLEQAGPDEGAWWSESAPQDDALPTFSAVLMRKDPPFDMEYVYATHLLERAEKAGARVFNRGEAIRNHPEKLAIAEFPELTVPTLVTSSPARLKAFYQELGDVIVKPLDGMGGTGIFRLKPGEVNTGSILEMLTDDGRQSVMAQRYIPEIVDGDKRILLIDGEPVPYCLARIPQAGETRGNLAAGGRGEARPLTESDWAIARKLGPVLAQRGLFLVGLDVIGQYVTEINVTSPTTFVEITEQTGFDVGDCFAAALEKAVGQSKP